MKKDNLTRAREYYAFVAQKNSQGVEKYLHPEVKLKGPLASLQGKKAVLEASQNYMKMLSSLKIRTAMASEDQVCVVYDIQIPNLVKDFPASVLMTFKEGLVVQLDLFYDATPFKEMREQIFSKEKA